MMAERCMSRAESLRARATELGITARGADAWESDAQYGARLGRRLVWDAPASTDYARPIVQDAADAAAWNPAVAVEVWHHAAGAIITPFGCDCDTPAGHRDAFAAIGRAIAGVTV